MPVPAYPPLTARRRKELASLSVKKYRDRLGLFVVEGVRSVEAALAGAAEVEALVLSEAVMSDERVQALAAGPAAPVYTVPPRDFEALSDLESSQGVLAVVRQRLFPAGRLATLRTVLALDGVQDPGNVGTLVRTAAWFGVEAVVAGAGTADFFNPKVVRATMGGLWDVRLVQAPALTDVLTQLRGAGFSLYGADMDGTDAGAWRPAAPSVLVLGSEAHGLGPEVARLLDERVTVPGAAPGRGVESLNVAVAAGIVVHAWQRAWRAEG